MNHSEQLKNEIFNAPSAPILDMFAKMVNVFNQHQNILVFISGGADSCVMLDAIHRIDVEKKARYVYCGTGMEYEAIKKHLAYLEDKYDIKIERVDPILPIPTCVRTYGVPFWSKHISERIYRLQRHHFQWEDAPFDELLRKYPKCKAALRWWCNDYPKRENGGESSLNIRYTPFLKEYMLANPPPPIAAKCCQKSKLEPSAKFQKDQGADLVCTGIRRAEKGQRAISFKTCITVSEGDGSDKYRPLFWLTDKDRAEYEKHYSVKQSDCYEVWGMTRTGCPGCPYGKDFEQELKLMQKYEPKFYRAALKIFGPSYEYTRGYLAFREMKKRE